MTVLFCEYLRKDNKLRDHEINMCAPILLRVPAFTTRVRAFVPLVY